MCGISTNFQRNLHFMHVNIVIERIKLPAMNSHLKWLLQRINFRLNLQFAFYRWHFAISHSRQLCIKSNRIVWIVFWDQGGEGTDACSFNSQIIIIMKVENLYWFSISMDAVVAFPCTLNTALTSSHYSVRHARNLVLWKEFQCRCRWHILTHNFVFCIYRISRSNWMAAHSNYWLLYTRY